jgi:hypothetical protein
MQRPSFRPMLGSPGMKPKAPSHFDSPSAWARYITPGRPRNSATQFSPRSPRAHFFDNHPPLLCQMFQQDSANPSSAPSQPPPPQAQVCYFSIAPSPTSSPASSPLSGYYHPETPSDPSHPLLALRQPPDSEPFRTRIIMDASKLLQIQTEAAYRSRGQSSQTGRSGSSSVSSASSTQSPLSPNGTVYCLRCRQEALAERMVKFGINLYYCSHCASMTGYGSG